jgi:hypothetical protein
LENGSQYLGNGAQYLGNEAQYLENRSQYFRNGDQYLKDTVQYLEEKIKSLDVLRHLVCGISRIFRIANCTANQMAIIILNSIKKNHKSGKIVFQTYCTL